MKEGQINVLVSRIQVNDKDTRGTPAWRAKYTIQGDSNNNFRITTDPETNEGLLYVEKVFCDYDNSRLNFQIQVFKTAVCGVKIFVFFIFKSH